MNSTATMSTLVAVERHMSIYGPFVLTTLGVIGNTLSILIFLSPRYRRQSSHFYLLSLALSDLCFLIINLVEDTFRNHNELYDSRINFLDRSSSFLCIFVQYARNETRLLSSWIIVSFTIERLLVVFHPLKRAIICRRKIARFVVLVLVISSLLCNINVPFHYGIVSLSNSTEPETICDILPKYRSIYMRFAIATMITVYLLPMCIIGFVNTLICCKLWRNSLIVERVGTIKRKKDKHNGYDTPPLTRHSSYFSEFLSCLHWLPRSSSSSFVPRQLQQRDRSSFSQFNSSGKLWNHNNSSNTDKSQVNGYQSIEGRHSQTPTRSQLDLPANCSTNSKISVSSVKTHIQSRTQRVTATLLLVSCSFLLLNTPYCAVWIANYVQGFRNAALKSIKEITELFMLMNFCINFLLYCVSGKAFRSELICLLRCQWRELYDRSEGERLMHRTARPKITIQLNETKLRSRSILTRPNNHKPYATTSSSTNSKHLIFQRSSR